MSHMHLTYDNRSHLQLLHAAGYIQKDIAYFLGVHPSTICRELKRNTIGGRYCVDQAHNKSVMRRHNASDLRIKKVSGIVRRFIDTKLAIKWSPEQIAGVLKASRYFVSYASIYRYIRVDKKAGGFLYTHQRHGGKKYNYSKGSMNGRGSIINRIDISKRPKIVNKKQRFGDLEADTIIGGGGHKNVIVSLVDKRSKLTMLCHSENKGATAVTNAIISRLKELPKKMKKTITYDNGKEFSYHEKIAEVLKVKCYFARPYHSCDRGLNEHTNGLVRQFLPKKTDFSLVTNEHLQDIEDQLNDRPRKVLGYRTPREVFVGKRRPAKIAFRV